MISRAYLTPAGGTNLLDRRVDAHGQRGVLFEIDVKSALIPDLSASATVQLADEAVEAVYASLPNVLNKRADQARDRRVGK